MFMPQKKNQYALRAVFELARRKDGGPVKISEIARAQSIPPRFLEVILSQLKGSGIVASKRGFYGGYYLVRSPEEIRIGDIFRFMDGPPEPLICANRDPDHHCDLKGRCAFAPLWNKVKGAIDNVYDETTIQDLLETAKDRE